MLHDDWHDLVEVSVRLCPERSAISPACAAGEATEEQIAAIRHIIDTDLAGIVDQVFFESKEQMWENFIAASPDAMWGGIQLAPEDMQASFRLSLTDPQYLEIVSETLIGREGVDEVDDMRDQIQPLFTALNRFSVLAAGLAALMLLTAALLITTTIRLSAVSRRRETSIMRLVGASNWFVQLPFVLEGAIAALLGSLFAIGGLWLGVRYLITDWLGQAIGFVELVSTRDVLLIAPVLIAIALLLAVVSSVATLRKYTRV
jgi:cell division transport system permease protein